jgi:hypothetical protein
MAMYMLCAPAMDGMRFGGMAAAMAAIVRRIDDATACARRAEVRCDAV